jgi:hypothetical protein
VASPLLGVGVVEEEEEEEEEETHVGLQRQLRWHGMRKRRSLTRRMRSRTGSEGLLPLPRRDPRIKTSCENQTSWENQTSRINHMYTSIVYIW